MSTRTNKYYLQALDAYPYNLLETMEALNYALSYDKEYAPAHCLLGKLYMEQLKDYEMAEYHYEQALICNLDYIGTYENYSLLLIILGDYHKALKLIDHGLKIRGGNRSLLLYHNGLLYEYQKEYEKAKLYYKQAYKECCTEDYREFLNKESERIKSKLTKRK
jgi:tetratricopeptide (TPR) repeat protein